MNFLKTDTIRIYGLGPFYVQHNDKCIKNENWNSKKALNLFKYLLIHRKKTIHCGELIDIFWPGVSFAIGKKRLYNTVYLLRKNLDITGILIQKNSSYSLNSDLEYWFDWEEFIELSDKIDDQSTLEEIKGVYELYRGDFMPGLHYEDWVDNLRQNLKDRYLDLNYYLAKKLYKHNKLKRSYSYLSKAIKEDPYVEKYYCLSIKVLTEMGKISDALALYEKYEKLLQDDLGIKPGEKIFREYKNIKSANISLELKNNTTVAGIGEAFKCTIDIFNQIYGLEKRQILRTNTKFTMLIINFSNINLPISVKSVTDKIARIFRCGDVISYHKDKIYILLHQTPLEKGKNVLKRLLNLLKDNGITQTPELDWKEISDSNLINKSSNENF